MLVQATCSASTFVLLDALPCSVCWRRRGAAASRLAAYLDQLLNCQPEQLSDCLRVADAGICCDGRCQWASLLAVCDSEGFAKGVEPALGETTKCCYVPASQCGSASDDINCRLMVQARLEALLRAQRIVVMFDLHRSRTYNFFSSSPSAVSEYGSAFRTSTAGSMAGIVLTWLPFQHCNGPAWQPSRRPHHTRWTPHPPRQPRQPAKRPLVGWAPACPLHRLPATIDIFAGQGQA